MKTEVPSQIVRTTKQQLFALKDDIDFAPQLKILHQFPRSFHSGSLQPGRMRDEAIEKASLVQHLLGNARRRAPRSHSALNLNCYGIQPGTEQRPFPTKRPIFPYRLFGTLAVPFSGKNECLNSQLGIHCNPGI
jgi:hypothetical protein